VPKNQAAVSAAMRFAHRVNAIQFIWLVDEIPQKHLAQLHRNFRNRWYQF
jgi:hypothetical protein